MFHGREMETRGNESPFRFQVVARENSGELHSGVNTYEMNSTVSHRAFGSSLFLLLGFTELVFEGAIELTE